jgi:hypothetical protein
MPLFSLIMCRLGDRPDLGRFIALRERSTCTDYALIVVGQGGGDVIAAIGGKVKVWPRLASA